LDWTQHISSSPFLFESFRGKSVFDIAFSHPISWLCAVQIATTSSLFQKNAYIQKSLSENTIIKIIFLLCDVTLNYPAVIFQLLFRRCPFLNSVRNYIVLTDICYGLFMFRKKLSLPHPLQLRIVQFLSFSSRCFRLTIREINCHRHN
jgi:hypothetical protein